MTYFCFKRSFEIKYGSSNLAHEQVCPFGQPAYLRAMKDIIP